MKPDGQTTASGRLYEPHTAVTATQSLERMRAAGWDDQLLPGEFYLSTHWMKVLERRAPDTHKYVATFTYDSAVRVAASLHEVDATAGPLSCVADRLAELSAHDGASVKQLEKFRSLLLPSLSIGGRTAGRTGILGSSKPSTYADVRSLLAEASDQARGFACRSLAALYVDAESNAVRSALSEAGYLEFPSGTTARLPVDFASYDEYLARFTAHARRNFRVEARRVREAGIRVGLESPSEENLRLLGQLSSATARRHGWDHSARESTAINRAIASELPEAFRLLVARSRKGAAVGALAFIHWRNEIHTRSIGIDREGVGKLPVYFALLFHATIQLALECDVHLIDFSLATGDTKRARGCQMVAQYGYVKCLDSAAMEELGRLLAR